MDVVLAAKAFDVACSIIATLTAELFLRRWRAREYRRNGILGVRVA